MKRSFLLLAVAPVLISGACSSSTNVAPEVTRASNSAIIPSQIATAHDGSVTTGPLAARPFSEKLVPAFAKCLSNQGLIMTSMRLTNGRIAYAFEDPQFSATLRLPAGEEGQQVLAQRKVAKQAAARDKFPVVYACTTKVASAQGILEEDIPFPGFN